MGNAAGVAKQAAKSTKFMVKAVASALKKKLAPPKPDPKDILRQKLIDYGSRNQKKRSVASTASTNEENTDMVQELSHETGPAGQYRAYVYIYN